jgi:hypothetical protein
MSDLNHQETGNTPVPHSLNEVLADLKGFGIEEFDEILTITSNGKQVRLRIANIPSEEERMALLAVEDLKGYLWMQQVKKELISRSVSWINGVDLRALKPVERLVTDPTDGLPKDIQVVIRELLGTWGQEIVNILWRILMVHAQSIEERLLEQFPDAALMTDAERRYTERVTQEIEAEAHEVLLERVGRLYDEDEAVDSEGTKN